MGFPTPQYSRSRVNKAGAVLVSDDYSPEELVDAFVVLENWRACHGYPINTFQATLRTKLKRLDPDAVVSQRLKRTPSIIEKLKRPDRTQLARMQDIGGLRAVVADLDRVAELVRSYTESDRFTHELVRHDDYIANPKDSGYRSVHLVYKYHGNRESAAPYKGLQVELQVRTRLQHAWATAVETMGTFLRTPLKASQGPDEWLSFFELVGSAFASIEGTMPIPGYEDIATGEIYGRVARDAARLSVRENLQAYTSVVQAASATDARTYHLVVLNTEDRTVEVRSFPRSGLDEASAAYAIEERRALDGAPIQVVLVSTSSLEQLRTAYPSYFLDTEEFLHQLDAVVALA